MDTQNVSATATITEKEFRDGVMPRAQLSKLACEIALEKTTRGDVNNLPAGN